MNWFNSLLRPPAEPPAPATRPDKVRRARAPAAPVAGDPEELRRLLAAASNEEERRQGAIALGLALAQQRRAPQGADLPGTWVAAICQAPDQDLALGWLAGLEGETWLGEIACGARYAEVRLAAAQRILDPAILKSVARHSRGRDKGVYRHCSELLQERRRAGTRARQAEQLASALQSLLAANPVSVSHLLDLEREVRALGDDPQALALCQPLIEQANARVLQQAQEQRALQTLAAATSALREAIARAPLAEPETLAAWHTRALDLHQQSAALPQWLASQSTAKALAALLPQIDEDLAALAHDQAQAQAAARFLEALEARAPGAAIDGQTAQQWEQLTKPRHSASRAALLARWQALQAPAVEPAPAVPAPAATVPPPVDPQLIEPLLEELETAVEQGHLGAGEEAAHKLKEISQDSRLRGAQEARLQRALARLTQLRSWAKWSAARKREDLLRAAEDLLTATPDVDELAAAIPALREQWKQLNAQGASGKSLWERFDATLTKAYAPVAAERAAAAAQRAQARAHKEALLAQWEAALAAAQAQPTASEAMEALRGQMREQWRAAPLAGFRDERLLRKRADALSTAIETSITAARTAEVQRREELIVAAEALAAESDLRKATSACKALQERWRAPAGAPRLPRGMEQKLWQRFRAACNAVFGRRETQRALEEGQREERQKARVQCLDVLAAALGQSDAGQIRQALATFRKEWDAMGVLEGREDLQRRARDLGAQAQRRIEALQQDAYRSRLENLAAPAALAELEPTALAHACAQRETLLLDMEMALGIPSPAAFQDARRRRQLEQLQRHFRASAAQPPRVESLLEQLHAIAAPVDPLQAPRIGAIVQKMVENHAAAAPRRPGPAGKRR